MINLIILKHSNFLGAIALEIVKDNDSELWHKIIQDYPELAELHSPDRRQLSKALTKIRKRLRPEFDLAAKQFALWWPEISPQVTGFFEKFFCLQNTEPKTFSAAIGIGPIYPRDLVKESFLLPYFATKIDFAKISIHEISHFYFYRKMKELAEKINLPSTHDLWIISEILVPSLINSRELKSLTDGIPFSCYATNDALIKSSAQIYDHFWQQEKNADLFWPELLNLKIGAEDLNPKYSPKTL
ncbi:MAG: hypothetical protein HY931_00790 [Candidatus Falkowbacteria bacterium]|nr:MAG: hypothetical protein HY931_00790 [Candidatus Falkowbacteria bacterium]